jgi:cell division protein FtsI (penicillin-binding protein 3)
LAQLNGYTSAGKTGMAQKIDPQTRSYSETKFITSFVGFAPAEHPAAIIIVVLDAPEGGILWQVNACQFMMRMGGEW